MSIKSVASIADDLARGTWGREYDDDGDARKANLLANADLSGACLLALLQRADKILLAIADGVITDRCQELKGLADGEVDSWLADRERRHGPCPKSVRKAISGAISEGLGRNIRDWRTLPRYVFSARLPEKGTAARRDYDSWMRRKVKEK